MSPEITPIPDLTPVDKEKRVQLRQRLHKNAWLVEHDSSGQYRHLAYRGTVQIDELSPSFHRLIRHTNPAVLTGTVLFDYRGDIHKYPRFNKGEELTVRFPEAPLGSIHTVELKLNTTAYPVLISKATAYDRTGEPITPETPGLSQATIKRLVYLESLSHPENRPWQFTVIETLLDALEKAQTEKA